MSNSNQNSKPWHVSTFRGQPVDKFETLKEAKDFIEEQANKQRVSKSDFYLNFRPEGEDE